MVADAWQGKGVGGLLLQALARHARAAGIVRLHGITLATNQAMQNLARKLGFVQHADPQDATVRWVEKALTPEDLPVVTGAVYPAAANDAAPGAGNRMPLPARARTGTATGSLSGAEPG